MKAWIITDKDNEYGSMIVYAETRNNAKKYAFRYKNFEDCEWIDLRVRRFTDFDKYYNGSAEVDFDDPKMRVILVRDFEWNCLETSFECKDCVAKQYCSYWEG